MGLLDKLGESSEARALSTVVDYGVRVEPHVNKAGVKSYGFKIFPILSTGDAGRFGDMWIRIGEGPEALRAFVRALPRILKAAEKLDAEMVKAGEWQAVPAAKAPTKSAAKAEAPATRSVLDDLAADDLPA